MLYRKCPICGNKKAKILSNISMCLQEGNPLPSTYNVVSCLECGFTYADVNATQKEYDYYYSNYNVYTENNSLKRDFRDEEYQYAYELIISRVGLNAKILDIGCGSGDFLEYLKNKGFKDLCGMDPSESSIGMLEKKGMKGIWGRISDPVSEKEWGKYDVVVSTTVIEHIYDLSDYLLQILKYMKKDTKSFLLLDAPAAESFGEYICAVPNYFNCEHINYFSKISLDNLLGKFSLFRINENVYFLPPNGEKAIMALYELRDEKAFLQYDYLSEESLEKYFDQITSKEEELREKVDKILLSKKKLYIWGCGSYTMWIMKKYPQLLERMECFIDNNAAKQGQHILGKGVYSPAYIENANDIIVTICSMNNAHDIKAQIMQLVSKSLIVIL